MVEIVILIAILMRLFGLGTYVTIPGMNLKVEIGFDLPAEQELLDRVQGAVAESQHAEIGSLVEPEIDEFEKWFVTQAGNTPLMGVERAILKTYLGWKVLRAAKADRSPSDPGRPDGQG